MRLMPENERLQSTLLSKVDREQLSPMMQHYYDTKKKHENHILFYRLGDFYEMFFDDAVTVSKELELTLTGRECGLPERAPMCGVPFHAAKGYIKKLLTAGYLVAVCEQLTDPKEKGMVERGVIRIVTPGTVTEDDLLDESKNNFIASVYAYKNEKESGAAISFADISTGEVYLFTKSGAAFENEIINELSRFSPVELIFNERFLDCNAAALFAKDKLNLKPHLLDEADFDIEIREKTLLRQFAAESLDSLKLTRGTPETASLCGLFGYIHDTQKSSFARFSEIKRADGSRFMSLDLAARRNLELTETAKNKERKGSLLWVLDSTETAMGRRLLKSYIEKPLTSPAEIIKRLDGVGELTADFISLQGLRESLSGVYDMERLITRIVFGTASPRDLKAISAAASKLPAIKNTLGSFKTKILTSLSDDIDILSDINALIENAICENPPVSPKDGGIINNGFNADLDKYREVINNAETLLSDIEKREREKTGIKNLKVGYNRVFGYYIEVTKSGLSAVPESYIRRQTLAAAERFVTEELKETETRVLTANERINALEYDIFKEVRDFTAAATSRIQKTAEAVAALDVLCSFAEVARKNRYVKPEISVDGVIDIRAGRHPSLELIQKNEIYVPNDIYLDEKDNRMYIITGPNMSGKSTYMRQTALITLMAQIGSFVPADYAKISVVDKIFTRVGASDDLTAGQSTFMVEMSEVADILKNAGKHSLVILDEVGRGTSTFDGVAIATAVAEHIALDRNLGCKTLFATHYHELIELEGKIGGIKNYSIAVKKRGNEIKFLRKIMPGGIDDSYGIDVARLAGVPPKVLKRARDILEVLETERKIPKENSSPQISVSEMKENEIIGKLKKINVNEYTPVDALLLLKDLISELD
jgi:DNA mismatch repair protein MutS